MKKIIIVLFLLMAINIVSADWPQFLGPNRNAVSPEKGLLRKWPKNGPKVLWTIPVGEGFSGPAIYKGKIYMLDKEGQKEMFVCYDFNTGKKIWDYPYDTPGKYSHPGGRTVPTIDGDYAYVCGGLGHLHCIDLNTKKVVWKKNIWTDFGGEKTAPWGLAQHPYVYNDMVILSPQTPKVGVVAYDKKSGKIKWKTGPIGRAGYVPVNIINIHGQDQVVTVSAGPKKARSGGKKKKKKPAPSVPYAGVVGVDPANGKILWSFKEWKCDIPVPQVIDAGDNRLYVGAGYQAGCALFKVEKNGSKYSTKKIYMTMDYGTHVHAPVIYKGHFYAHCSDNRGRKDGMACMSIDGKVKWQTKDNPFFDKGGFIFADNMMISVDGKDGLLYLTEPNPNGFKVLSKAQMLNKGKIWAPLALTDGKLLIRDGEEMKCVLIK